MFDFVQDGRPWGPLQSKQTSGSLAIRLVFCKMKTLVEKARVDWKTLIKADIKNMIRNFTDTPQPILRTEKWLVIVEIFIAIRRLYLFSRKALFKRYIWAFADLALISFAVESLIKVILPEKDGKREFER